MIEAILPVLQDLWAQAWDAGWEAAAEAAGIQAAIDQQQRQNQVIQMSATWAAQIAATTLKILAGLLAAAGGAVTVAALQGALKDPGRANGIAQTETTRLMGEAAQALYHAGGITKVRWVTEPPDPCPLCIANEQAGPWPLGVPFPSGATSTPQHPNCRCAVIPA